MLTGLILSGGPEARLGGRIKALMPFGDRQLIHHQIRVMREVCSEIIVATPDPKPYLPILDVNVRILTDYYKGHGPLGGMFAGFSLAQNDSIWAVGSDLPCLSPEAALLLMERKGDAFEAVLPMVQGGIYPLHGVYDKSCADDVEAVLREGRHTASSLLRQVSWADVPDTVFLESGIDPSFVRSFDTEEEYDKLMEAVNAHPVRAVPGC